LINYDGGVSDQLGLTEGYRATTRLATPGINCPHNEMKPKQHSFKTVSKNILFQFHIRFEDSFIQYTLR